MIIVFISARDESESCAKTIKKWSSWGSIFFGKFFVVNPSYMRDDELGLVCAAAQLWSDFEHLYQYIYRFSFWLALTLAHVNWSWLIWLIYPWYMIDIFQTLSKTSRSMFCKKHLRKIASLRIRKHCIVKTLHPYSPSPPFPS